MERLSQSEFTAVLLALADRTKFCQQQATVADQLGHPVSATFWNEMADTAASAQRKLEAWPYEPVPAT